MKTSWKYALLLGVSLALTSSSEVLAEGMRLGSLTGINPVDVYKYMISSVGFPVLDLTSVPAHSVVAIEQQFVRLRTEAENALKGEIKERQSEIQNALQKRGRYRLLSQVEVNPGKDMSTSWPWVKEGLIDVTDEIESEGKSTTVALTQGQQKQWTSAAGSLDTKRDYQIYRQYVEQEQAIRMLAQALVLKQQAHEKLKKLQEELDAHYKETDVPGNLTGSDETVNKKSDYNKTLREYAYQSLIYDQLLSLEQQVLGMRLQAKGGMYGQGLQVISDNLDVKGITE